jgi:hypothetical protein
MLGRFQYFTVGEDECEVLGDPRGSRAPRAAAAIHKDFERGFTRRRVVGYEDFVACGGALAPESCRACAWREGLHRPGRGYRDLPLQRIIRREKGSPAAFISFFIRILARGCHGGSAVRKRFRSSPSETKSLESGKRFLIAPLGSPVVPREGWSGRGGFPERE